jgi:transcriptional regulator with XRE-family HTH domain
MVERIRQLIEYTGLSSSQFADRIEVPRAILSHILSGRNKPSLDVILKVISNYRTINPDWLLIGEGEMLNNVAATVAPELPVTIVEPIHESPDQAAEAMHDKVQNSNAPETIAMADSTPEKTVKQIVFFYTDNTFSVYVPES